jgi:hypothetical protein
MKKLSNLLWSIPALAVYFYTATVLTEYGYASYFKIPTNFISTSLSDNIIYFFQLFTAVKYQIGFIKWWAWLILVFVILFIAFLYYSHYLWKKTLTLTGVVIFFLLLGGFFHFGGKLAANNAEFWIPASDCPPIGSDSRYIIPGFNESVAVFVPIDQNNKIIGGFLVKNLTELPCKLEYKNIGRIIN